MSKKEPEEDYEDEDPEEEEGDDEEEEYDPKRPTIKDLLSGKYDVAEDDDDEDFEEGDDVHIPLNLHNLLLISSNL